MKNMFKELEGLSKYDVIELGVEDIKEKVMEAVQTDLTNMCERVIELTNEPMEYILDSKSVRNLSKLLTRKVYNEDFLVTSLETSQIEIREDYIQHTEDIRKGHNLIGGLPMKNKVLGNRKEALDLIIETRKDFTELVILCIYIMNDGIEFGQLKEFQKECEEAI